MDDSIETQIIALKQQYIKMNKRHPKFLYVGEVDFCKIKNALPFAFQIDKSHFYGMRIIITAEIYHLNVG